MVLPALSQVIGTIGDTLNDLSVDPSTVDSILSSLAQLQDDLPDGDAVSAVPAPAFGTLPAGTSMGLHTDHAHQYLLTSLTEMLQTLGLLDEGVRVFRKGAENADEYTDVQLTTISNVVAHSNRLNRRRDGAHQ